MSIVRFYWFGSVVGRILFVVLYRCITQRLPETVIESLAEGTLDIARRVMGIAAHRQIHLSFILQQNVPILV